MRKTRFLLVIALGSVAVMYSCGENKTKEQSPIRFTQLPSSETGITFNNSITENDSVNLIVNEYAYMGGGVGIGDFNNDQLPDVFFAGSVTTSRLYINKGKFSFEDITQKAGVTTDFWATGVSIVDINNDGYDDIYVCASGSKNAEKRKNRLYINDGHLGFSEQAEEYGLADSGFSTQAAFFDYDNDGDLDMYLLNHALYERNANTILPPDSMVHPIAADKLFRNEGIVDGRNHPFFKDVSAEAGIKEIGYGLGLVISDFNGDNRPDIYVANDYIANDKLWLNNGNGSFSNRIASALKHQSYYSMGVDAADINNDGLADIATLDMLPEDNERKKMMYTVMNYDRYELERLMNYQPEFMRNMLQLNNGIRNVHDTVEPFFSEIGQLAGIHETDWSWSVLIADFDNDGWKDMHVTNGFGRDMLNNDFMQFRASPEVSRQFNVEERNKAVVNKLNEYGSRLASNYFFRNNGNLTFSDLSATAGINMPSVSNGCAYADFDGDGDLDLVTNNINQEAFVLRNDLITSSEDTTHHYLNIKLQGDSLNKNGFGAAIKVYSKGQVQFLEQAPVRGYASTVDKILHIGLGTTTVVDSVVVTWPNDKVQILNNIPANQTLVLQQKEANKQWAKDSRPAYELFTEVSEQEKIDFWHKDKVFFDYRFQSLLPQKYSQLGPFIAEGDVNGDGLTDFFVGGAFSQSGRFFLQQSDGSFSFKDLVNGGKNEEDLGCLLFDADGDKDLDLFINSGSQEFEPGSAYYMPRLYKNDGKGNFTLDAAALPKTIYTSAQCIAANDYDGDGDIDLFIGGRLLPGQYPLSPRSYILQNNGSGIFTDVTAGVCKALMEPGMVTAAIWTDFDGDQKQDLVVTGEWMNIRFFKNTGSQLQEVTDETGLVHMKGQWRSLCTGDLDGDGDMDIIAGNLGLNNKYKASPKEPIKMFAKDLDNNGSIDPIMAYYIANKNGERGLYPAIDRDQFAGQVPFIKNKYLLHETYAKENIETILADNKEGLLELTCEETRSCWLENKGGGKFEMHALPLSAQLAPINAIVCTDVDRDGKADLILAGNEYQTEVMTGRYDASYGVFLKGSGKGLFAAISPMQSGLVIDGDVKDLKLISNAKKERLLFAAINNEKMKVFKLK